MKKYLSFLYFFVIVVFIIAILFNEYTLFGFSSAKTKVLLLALFFVSGFATYLFFSYLSLDMQEKKHINDLRRNLEELYIKLQLVEQGKQEELTQILIDKIEKSATDEVINKILKDKIKSNSFEVFEGKYNALISGLEGIISTQNNKANVNLFLGIASAIVGVSFMVSYFVSINFSQDISLVVFAMNFLPKLSIVLIIETLSFFFLKLYKRSLGEVKYFSNQLTETRLKLLSFEIALLLEDRELIKENVLNLMNVKVSENTNEKYDFRSSIDELSKLVKAIGNKTD